MSLERPRVSPSGSPLLTPFPDDTPKRPRARPQTMRTLPCWILRHTDHLLVRPFGSSFARCPSSSWTIYGSILTYSSSCAAPSAESWPSEVTVGVETATSALARVWPWLDPARSARPCVVWGARRHAGGIDPSSPTYGLAVCTAASCLEVVTVANFSLASKIRRYCPICDIHWVTTPGAGAKNYARGVRPT